MKVKCITNKINTLPLEMIISHNFNYKKFDVIQDVEYIVYSIQIDTAFTWYCICAYSECYIPLWYPSPLFEIIDNHLSRYWVLGLDYINNRYEPFLSFPEWVKDQYFYSELIEGNSTDPNALIFLRYKDLMNLEFPDPSVKEIAQVGDDNWLICPDCIDAWESKNDRDALVRCLKCNKIFNNPRYTST